MIRYVWTKEQGQGFEKKAPPTLPEPKRRRRRIRSSSSQKTDKPLQKSMFEFLFPSLLGPANQALRPSLLFIVRYENRIPTFSGLRLEMIIPSLKIKLKVKN